MVSERPGSRTASAYRLLPSVDELLAAPALVDLAARTSRALLLELARGALERWREAIAGGALEAGELEGRLAAGELVAEIAEAAGVDARRGVRPAVNATGIVLHTGLGRAPWHPEAARAAAEVGERFCLLEVDRETGQRNRRDDRTSELVRRLTGAEAAIAVNNNAAAVLLVLNTFGRDREVVVSRGELVEIGGSFRIPDVMERAGARLREVGTTNRTRAADYRGAVGPDTGLLMKVHTSNFRVEGFTEEVGPAELGALGRELGVPTAFDLGSGLYAGPGGHLPAGLGPEPRVEDALASGVDVVLFSGDKLFGGPQAGLLLGTAETVRALRANPLYRALRLDKTTLCALERTLELFLAGRADELPARRALARDPAELAAEAAALARALDALPGLRATTEPGESQPGSGSAPGVTLPTTLVRTTADALRPERLAHLLRRADPAVFARVKDDAVWLDPRTLLPGEAEHVVAAYRAAVEAPPGAARGAR